VALADRDVPAAIIAFPRGDPVGRDVVVPLEDHGGSGIVTSWSGEAADASAGSFEKTRIVAESETRGLAPPVSVR
jgi:hypothetical protein